MCSRALGFQTRLVRSGLAADLLRLGRRGLHGGGLGVEVEVVVGLALGVVLEGDSDVAGGLEVALQEHLGHWVLDVLSDGATERAGAEVRVVALFDEEVLGLGVHRQVDALMGQTGRDLADLQIDDLVEVFFGQRLEDDDLVEAVDELGAEEPLDFFEQNRLDVVEVRGLGALGEAEAAAAPTA